MRLCDAPELVQACDMNATAEKIRLWLEQAMATSGLSANELAQKSKVNRATIFRALKPGYEFVTSSRTVAKLAEAMGVPGPEGSAELYNPAPGPTNVVLPIIHEVGAGVWRSVDDYVDPNPEVYPVAEYLPAYAKWPQWIEAVRGDSYNKKVPDGSLVHVVDAIAMGYEPRHGDTVVVVRRRHQGAMIERTLKEVEQTPTGFELWPRSFNPKWNEPLNYTADTKEGEDIEVEIAGKVVRAYIRFDN
jgi:hypothetical protein